MALKYVDTQGRNIQNIPAMDLSNEECEFYARQEQMSLAEFEGALIKRGLYKYAEAPKKAPITPKESE